MPTSKQTEISDNNSKEQEKDLNKPKVNWPLRNPPLRLFKDARFKIENWGKWCYSWIVIVANRISCLLVAYIIWEEWFKQDYADFYEYCYDQYLTY